MIALSHIYPSTLRHQMAELWGIPGINEWWLPDEGTCPPVVRGVRSFLGNRLPHTEGESRSEDQRNIKGIFSQLSLHESLKAGLVQAGGFEIPSSIKSQSPPTEDPSSQGLIVHTADVDIDQDVGLDSSILGQSREDFHNIDV